MVLDREEFKSRILHQLGRGQGKSYPCRLIAYYCGSNDRSVRYMIRDLIEEGYPIASTTGKHPGFFVADTPEEVKDYAQSLRDRLIEDARRRRDFLRASYPILHPEQIRMEI